MPVVITQDLIINAQSGSVFPLNYARIGYQSYLEEGMLSLSTGTIVSGYPLANCLTSQTFEVAKVDGAAMQIEIDLGQAQDVDYVALTSKNSTVYTLLYSNDNVNYTSVVFSADSSKKAKMALFESVNARYWRLFIGSTSETELTNLKLGIALAMYRPIYGGHSPVTLNRATVTSPNMSEGGEFLGSTITRKGFNGAYSYQNLPAEWYRDFFDPFVEYARTDAYYIAWNPLQFPLEVVYGWTMEDFAPSNMGVRDLMQVSWNLRGYDAS